jgi:hypothetical protein
LTDVTSNLGWTSGATTGVCALGVGARSTAASARVVPAMRGRLGVTVVLIIMNAPVL